MYEVRKTLGLPEKGVVTTHGVERERIRISKKEGHDALIETLSKKNTKAVIVFLDGGVETGKLLQSDRFTITLSVIEDEPPTIFYKHAIKSIKMYVEAKV
jgi:sRNA-binding regulator protein Hfq